MSTRYRKKPVVIEAMQLGEGNAGAIVQWITDGGRHAVMRGGPRGGSKGATVTIRTLEGNHLAQPGDWIIRGVHGEFYPCKPDVFEATYELAEGGAA